MQDGFSPVYVASQKGHTEVVDLLIQAGADINLATTDQVCCILRTPRIFPFISVLIFEFGSLSLSLSLSLFSSSYEGGPATCAYWVHKTPGAQCAMVSRNLLMLTEIIEQSENITIWHLRCILS